MLKCKALGMLQGCDEGSGLEAWRILTQEFEPKVPGRFQGMLTSLLTPATIKDIPRGISDRTKAVTNYERDSKDLISDSINISVLTIHLVAEDGELQKHLRLNARKLNTIGKAMREAARTGQSQGRACAAAQAKGEASSQGESPTSRTCWAG